MKVDKEQGEEASTTVALEEKISDSAEDQAGSDPGKGHEALAGSNPEPMHEDFYATAYLDVHDNHKLRTDENVIFEDPQARIDNYDEMKEILHQRMFKSGSYKTHTDHEILYNALELSMDRDNQEELHEELTKSRKRRRDDDQDPPPPPKDTDRRKRKKPDSDASASQQPLAQTSSAWTSTDTKDTPSKGNENAHLPKITTRADWFRPLPEEERPATPEPEWIIPPIELPKAENNWADALAKTYKAPEENKLLSKTRDMSSFIKWYCRRIGKEKLTKADLEGTTFMVVKGFHKNNISLQFQMEECHLLLTDQVDLVNPEGHRIVPDVTKLLPLGGPPGQVTIQPQFFFNKDMEYLLSGDKERKSALSISKLKAARYLDFGLEELVPSLWIESERDYDISAAYGITHYVISLKTYERYGYNYLREIVLRRADYKEYKISEVDFKNLHLNDFKDLYLLHLQSKLNHLSKSDKIHLYTAINLWIKNIVIRKSVKDLQLGIESYQTKLNLEQPNWDATDFVLKEDYTIVYKPRAVIYKDRNDQKKMMRLDEVHKFSYGTLTRVKEKLDHMVKDFNLYEYNHEIKTRIWSEDDKRRSEEFIEEIERRLKIRRIFRSLESFVGATG
ncbi:hypothetical protein Tco_1028389 [Tanacetum coccineum]|uniref:Uncharacterized protein n=1 Tax=Tanacetum coccineum TaxID=301880 RepID=A0ABQ5G0I0_9ASTR